MTKSKNKLGVLYHKLDHCDKSTLLRDLKRVGISHQRFYNWHTMPNERLLNMPTIMKDIVCRHLPQAQKLFKLPNPEVPTLFD
jgi:hypothetical protein